METYKLKNMPNKLSDDKQRISASLPKMLVDEVKKKEIKEGRTLTDVLADALIEWLNLHSEKVLYGKKSGHAAK